MKVLKIVSMLLLFGSLSFVACNLDGAEEEKNIQLLQGHWDLVEAYRNGKKTETLTGTFFEFAPENKLTYNLAGSREAVTYELDGKTLTPIDSRQKVTFAIEELDGQKLTLTMMMRNTPFKFILAKN